MGRRSFLGLLMAVASARVAYAEPPSADLAIIEATARAGYIYGLPYVEMARTRAARLIAGGQALDRFAHRRQLATARDKAVTTPNNDTLYSSAWLDLAQGPVSLATPDFGTRYWSVALMSMTTDNFAVLGTRTIGGGPANFLIVGPDWKDHPTPEGVTLIRSPDRWVWALARILVSGVDDLPAVHRLQDALTLTPQNSAVATPALPMPLKNDDAADFYRLVADLLIESPPPAADHAMLASLTAIGLVPGQRFNTAGWQNDQTAALATGIATAKAYLETARTSRARSAVNGWSLPPPQIGNFGDNYALRAAVALGGLAALPADEAMGLAYVGDGAPITGTQRWRLVFKEGELPPADAFWSLSLYERTPEGRLFFYDNPLDRFSIGDRTPGLVTGSDGSLELLIGHMAPADRETNWLPAPSGAFALILRVYLPRPAMRQGRWRPPQLSPVP